MCLCGVRRVKKVGLPLHYPYLSLTYLCANVHRLAFPA
ncbi:hypothetical protein X949_5966 [Burkholderia pseudomallei MSHR5609]|nr:hypothetical protein X945_6032 [Burkholderia pseudomallei ABCPW 107]KGS53048.1 hypothetical protein X949_5966 [Burkholderia pseudomallei MSHR5609]